MAIDYIGLTPHEEPEWFKDRIILSDDVAIPAGAGAGKVLTSDADGNGTWQAAAAGGVTNVTATSPVTSTGGATPDVSTSMNTNKLIGRGTVGVGVMEEITLGTGLSLAGTTLNASAVTPAALTKADDTNVTVTLTGTPSTALLQSVLMTLGWTGFLSALRGGTGATSAASTGIAQVLAGVWSWTTALASGTTATTQSNNDNSTKLATTAYVDAMVSSKSSGDKLYLFYNY